MLRGTSEEEKLLKNAKTEYSEEHEEIATYTAIETFAESVNDKETAKLARSIRRDEERMAKYLEGLIPTLTKSVVQAEVPASERRNGSRRQLASLARASRRARASPRARGGLGRSSRPHELGARAAERSAGVALSRVLSV